MKQAHKRKVCPKSSNFTYKPTNFIYRGPIYRLRAVVYFRQFLRNHITRPIGLFRDMISIGGVLAQYNLL